ncbi:MAG: O-antigen ligase family protein [Methylophilaceae bacterium]
MIKLPQIFIDAFQKENIHFFVMLLCILMQMLTIGWAYRFFAYANLIVVLIYTVYQYKASRNFNDYQWLKYPILFSLGFVAIHFVAVQNLVIIKEIRHSLLAIFLVIGIAMIINNKGSYIRKNAFRFTVLIILLYVITQAISLWFFNAHHGTTKNPHYLALYSSVGMVLAVYCFLNSSIKLKMMSGVCISLLGALLIQSSSRPVWIALTFTGLLATFFLKRKSQFYALLTIAVVLLVLTLTNLGNFAERSKDLIENIRTEERVAIWTETWDMQGNSSLPEWIVGHGLNSFEEAFKPYSSYHMKNIDFNSPHNYLLELLFTSGWLGIFLAFTMFWLIYKKLIHSIRLENEHRDVYMTLMAVLTTSIIFTGITLPFFTSSSMNIIALVVGAMFALEKSNQ